MSTKSDQLLTEIRNALRFLVSTHFENRQSQGQPFNDRQQQITENIDRVMKTGCVDDTK